MKTTLIALLLVLLSGGATRAQEGKPPELPGVPTTEMTPEEKAAAEAWAAEALAAEEQSPQSRVRRRLREAAEKARRAEEKSKAASKRKARSGSAAEKASREAAAEKSRAEREAAAAEVVPDAEVAPHQLDLEPPAPLREDVPERAGKSAARPAPKRNVVEQPATSAPERAVGAEAAANAAAAARPATGGSSGVERSAAPVANYVERHDASPAWARRAPLTNGQALLRSAFIPGLGQIQTGRPIRGYTFLAAAGLSLGSTIWMTARAAQANNLYESAPASVRQQAFDQAHSYASMRNGLIAMTALIWTVNAAEAYFLNGTTDK